jgi:hypothetical protein
VVILVHLATRATARNVERRAAAKLMLMRRLYEHGYSREQIIGLLRFIDFRLRLPEPEERRVWTARRQIEEEHQMPCLTYPERLSREEGRAEGRREGLLEALELGLASRFGAEGAALLDDARRHAGVERLCNSWPRWPPVPGWPSCGQSLRAIRGNTTVRPAPGRRARRVS